MTTKKESHMTNTEGTRQVDAFTYKYKGETFYSLDPVRGGRPCKLLLPAEAEVHQRVVHDLVVGGERVPITRFVAQGRASLVEGSVGKLWTPWAGGRPAAPTPEQLGSMSIRDLRATYKKISGLSPASFNKAALTSLILELLDEQAEGAAQAAIAPAAPQPPAAPVATPEPAPAAEADKEQGVAPAKASREERRRLIALAGGKMRKVAEAATSPKRPAKRARGAGK